MASAIESFRFCNLDKTQTRDYISITGDWRSGCDAIVSGPMSRRGRLIIYNRARPMMKKRRNFRYPEGIHLSAQRILQGDLLSIRRVLFIAAAKLIFAIPVQPVPRS